MFRFLWLWLGVILRLFRSRQDLLIENLALRQQLSVLKRRNRRPKLAALDKLFWVLARRFWSGWKKSLLIVTPKTVVRWHRVGFRLYWRLISKVKKQVGRNRLSKEIRNVIFRMVAENPTWGAPRIHGELLMLGFDVSERSVSRWMKRAPRDPDPARRWLAFLRNHREAIAAMDFFTVPTVTFQLLYCFFIIRHDRRQTSALCNVGQMVRVATTTSWATVQSPSITCPRCGRKRNLFHRGREGCRPHTKLEAR
jgi:putative transposase